MTDITQSTKGKVMTIAAAAAKLLQLCPTL